MPRHASSQADTPVRQLGHDTDYSGIGETLKELRAARRLRQEDLARELGVSPSYLSLLESGKRPTTRKVLRGLSDYLKVPAGYFVVEAMRLSGLEPRHRKVIEELRRELVEPALQRAFAKAPKRSRLVTEASQQAKEATS